MQQSRFPIAYWGAISYYRELVEAESPVFELYETYPKQTCRNRCAILTSQGIQELSVPVSRINGSKTLTKDVLISYEQDWQKIHWRALKAAYASSPYFDYYGMEIEELLFQKHKYLFDLTSQLHQRVCKWLELPVNASYSQEFQHEYPIDFLKQFEQRKTEKTYEYQQVFTTRENFVPDLSILDAILNIGPMARKLVV